MQNDDLDSSLRPLVHALRELPDSDPRSVKRVLARVRQDDGRPNARRRALRRYFARRSGWWAAAAVLVFGAGVTLFARSTAQQEQRGAPVVLPSADLSDTPVVPALAPPDAYEGTSDRLVARQFFIDYGQARQVALVGDFNQWNPRQHRLHRAGGSERWSIVVQLPAGLHKYAFIVDDSVWTPDPGALRTVDRDFGITSSLVLVQ